jgi:hypothetical protein
MGEIALGDGQTAQRLSRNGSFPPIADIRLVGEDRRMSFPKVFFDTNDGSSERGYWLGFEQSRKDLEALGADLREGATVTIYMPDELEMTATLRFDTAADVWWADPVESSITRLDG